MAMVVGKQLVPSAPFGDRCKIVQRHVHLLRGRVHTHTYICALSLAICKAMLKV